MALGEQIAAAVKEGLSAWKVFIATRQEAYNRQQDKRKAKAIECGEQAFFEMDKIIVNLRHKGLEVDDLFKEHIKKVTYWRRKFFKLNN